MCYVLYSHNKVRKIEKKKMSFRKSSVREYTFTVAQIYRKRSVCKWTCAVQAHAVQGPTVVKCSEQANPRRQKADWRPPGVGERQGCGATAGQAQGFLLGDETISELEVVVVQHRECTKCH